MRTIPTPGLSIKVATALDVVSSLIAAQMGYMLSMPFWHPFILSYVLGTSFVLFKWKDQITSELIKLSTPLQNRNSYDYFNKLLASRIRFKVKMLQEMFDRKKQKKPKEVYLFFDSSNTN